MNVSLDPNSNDTSFFLDLLRFGSAQAVCVGHAIVFFGVASFLRPPRFPYLQNLGVLAFFLLSGFLIAHVLSRSERDPNYSNSDVPLPGLFNRARRILRPATVQFSVRRRAAQPSLVGGHWMTVHGFALSSAYFLTAFSLKLNPRPGV